MSNLDFFLEYGYLHLRGSLEKELIRDLEIKTKIILENNKSQDINIDDLGVIRKICYLFDKDELFLTTLAHPTILNLVKELSLDCEQIVPTWEDLLVKMPLDGIDVPPHQDLGLQSIKSGRVFSIGIYLTDSNNNPVYFLPSSHKRGALTFSEIKQVYKDENDKFIPIYAKAGDILVHNVLNIHYSERNYSNIHRFTWYIEFRTVDELLKDSHWGNDWIYSRRAILYHAIQTRKKNNLPTIDLEFKDYYKFSKYLKNINLRIPHVTENINYNFDSPYYHFKN